MKEKAVEMIRRMPDDFDPEKELSEARAEKRRKFIRNLIS